MEDKIGDLERRISDIESRLMKLETGTKPTETVIPSKDFPSKSEEPSFPIGGVILLIVGGLILLSSLPNFLFNLGRSSSSAYLVHSVLLRIFWLFPCRAKSILILTLPTI